MAVLIAFTLALAGGVGGAAKAQQPPAVAAPPATTGNASSPPVTAPAFVAVDTANYRLSPEDVLEISVLDNPDLTRTVSVQSNGKISFPYLGSFQAGGLTIDELTRRMNLGLSQTLVRPQVSIAVRERRVRKVAINGPVKNGGERLLRDGWRVLNLVVDSGGLTTERPEWVSTTLLHPDGKVTPIDMERLLGPDPVASAKENIPLQEGDVLLVRELDAALTHIQVLGEVVRQGPVPAPLDGSPASVLAAAGGLKTGAAPTRATVKRGGKLISLDLNASLSGQTTGSAAFTLQPGDTLFIPQNKLTYAVLGAVGKAGEAEYPDSGGLTVSTALARSGGPSPDADTKNATLLHMGRDGKPNTAVAINIEKLYKGDLTADRPIEPGDVVFIPSKKQGRKFGVGDALSFLPFVNLFYR